MSCGTSLKQNVAYFRLPRRLWYTGKSEDKSITFQLRWRFGWHTHRQDIRSLHCLLIAPCSKTDGCITCNVFTKFLKTASEKVASEKCQLVRTKELTQSNFRATPPSGDQQRLAAPIHWWPCGQRLAWLQCSSTKLLKSNFLATPLSPSVRPHRSCEKDILGDLL